MVQLTGQVPTESTRISFHKGFTTDSGHFLAVYSDPDHTFIITDRTPFHPLDNTWPDQPGDRGLIVIGNLTIEISNCIMWPVPREGGTLHFDPSIRVHTRDAAFIFIVAHVVGQITANGQPLFATSLHDPSLVGKTVQLVVDPKMRSQLSATHSASHLMSLALNRATSSFWHKDVPKDSLGAPNFDQAAIVRSRIETHQAIDVYRLGKSLRKSGLSPDTLVAQVTDVQAEVNATVNDWIRDYAEQPIVIRADSDFLPGRRYWTVWIEDTEVVIPCGGTHVKTLGDIGRQQLTFVTEPDSQQLTIITKGQTRHE